jgi:hypothetical protein
MFSDRGGVVGRVVTILLTVAIVVGLLIGGLFLLEGGGASSAGPLGRNISSDQPSTADSRLQVTTTTDNPNAHCKPKPSPHDCRPPSS